MGDRQPSKWKIAGVLLGVSVLWVGVHFAWDFAFHRGAAKGGWSWGEALHYAAVAMAIFWYGIFVIEAKINSWFGRYRRLVGGLLLAFLVDVFFWSQGHPTDTGLLQIALVAFGVGWIAEVWVDGL